MKEIIIEVPVGFGKTLKPEKVNCEIKGEIVRCRDCKYCEYPQSEKDWCIKGHLHGKAETWFCADGERNEA